jgi:hypothetical protein
MFCRQSLPQPFFASRNHRFRHSVGVAVILALSGCGSSRDATDRLPVYLASGRLIYSKPLTGAFVVLHPKAGSDQKTPRPHGRVESDGSFALTSYDSNDGAPAGEYTVTVELRPLVKHGGDYSAGPNVLPAKYSRAETSPVKVTVAAGKNDLEPIRIAE